MIIEELHGEKLQRYRPVFLDLRGFGGEVTADYTISLFPSEVAAREERLSKGNIIVMFKKEEGRREKGGNYERTLGG